MTQSQIPNRIPQFKSLQEEAAFWDSQDTMDYPDEWQPVAVRFINKEKVVSVRFEPKTFADIQRAAQTKGLKPTTLVRMVMTEWLNRAQHLGQRL